MSPLGSFQCDHKVLLVILSYTISVLGAYGSLRLAAQIPRSSGRALAIWLSGAAIAMGGGAIWSMHFIGMIACRLPVPVAYDELTTLASLLVAIVVTGIGLFVVGRGSQSVLRLVAGGTFTGVGVAAMHYTGMAAMRMPARTIYRGGLVAVSILIAIVAATAALWLALNLRLRWQRLGASLVMGLAVCGMHYTAMAAAVFVPASELSTVGARPALAPDDLAYMVFGITLVILLMLSVGSSIIESRMAQESLRRAHAELERQVADRTAELAMANQDLKAEIAARERFHAERVLLAAFSADVGAALTKAETLEKALNLCAGAMVQHLGAATASIWRLDEKDNMLELVGSAWERKPLFGPEARVPVGEFRIGAIARDRKPALADLSAGPEREDDKDWARREGMVAFAGYPLIVGERLVGVVALFARKPLTSMTLDVMAHVVDEIALGIDRARAAEALRMSEASTRALIDNMLTGVITTDDLGRIETINVAAQKIFGYSPEEIVGQTLAALLPPSQARNSQAFLREARAKALGQVTEWEARRKSGEIFPMELALFDFQTPDGRRHSAGSVRDVSERQEVDRLKQEFVSTVSHELRTPLTSIRGSLGLIVGGAAGEIPAQSRALLDIAYKNTERLGRLVNDILDLEKIESGRMEFRLEFLEIGELLQAVLESNRAFAEQYGIRLELRREAPEAGVWADRDRLVQVFTNLISNAAKFSPKGAAVVMTLSRNRGKVRVSVADRGPGIPDEFRSRIFQRFQQADSSDTRQKGGTGLGLTITKSIVERLSGEILFDSHAGQGTTFHVDLPEHRAPEPQSAVVTRADNKPRILVCEDDYDQANLLSLMLQNAGCQTEIARNAMEAKSFLAQRPFDAMTLDIVLPGQDGVSLIHELRAHERTRDLPIIVVSVDAKAEQAGLTGQAVGVIDWLEKPVDPQRLLAAIRTGGRRATGRPRILHVEDDADVIQLLKVLLGERAEISTVTTCREAARALREGDFDLMVLDIALPDGSGLDLLPFLHRPPKPPIPVVVFSAHELSHDMARAIKAALVKSRTSNEEIVRTIESLVEFPVPGVV
jgi:PAS domain S-box-containing protein